MLKTNVYKFAAIFFSLAFTAAGVSGCAKGDNKSALAQEKVNINGSTVPADQQAKIQAMMAANRANAQQGPQQAAIGAAKAAASISAAKSKK